MQLKYDKILSFIVFSGLTEDEGVIYTLKFNSCSPRVIRASKSRSNQIALGKCAIIIFASGFSF